MRILFVVGVGGFLLAASPSEGAWRNLLKKGGQVVATPQPAEGTANDSPDSGAAVAPVASSVGGESSPLAIEGSSTSVEAPAGDRDSTATGAKAQESPESDALAVSTATNSVSQQSTVAMENVATKLESPAGKPDSAVLGGQAGGAVAPPPLSEAQANSVAQASSEPIAAQAATSPLREGAPVVGTGAPTVQREEILAVGSPTAPIESRPMVASVATPSRIVPPSAAANPGRSLEAAAPVEPPKVSENLTIDRPAARDVPPNPVALLYSDSSARVEKATPSTDSGPSNQASRGGTSVEASLNRLPSQASDRDHALAQPQAFEGKVVRVEGAYLTCSVAESSRLHVGMIVGIWNGSRQAARAQILSRRTGFVDLEITEDFGRERASVGSLLRVPH